MLFDLKNFNGEVFAKYVDRVDNLNRNELLKSGAVVEVSKYVALLPDQVGGHYISTPIKARIGGDADNYDGNTNITTDSRDTYTQGRIVVGRAHGWTEKDFTSDITGEDFLPAAEEVAEYWDDVDQETLLASLKGVFSMTGAGNADFVSSHTYDISEKSTENTFDETTLNTGIQKALGDNKGKFALAIMHSAVATNLENLNLVGYAKYTDENGIQRDVALATVNGRPILIDDNMPTETIDGVGEDASYIKYTTYVLGNGAIEYTNCGAKVPAEMGRDPKVNGGETTLYSRQRKVFSPYGISFTNNAIISPTKAQLENGSNWGLAFNNQSQSSKKAFFPAKAIPIARIITRG